MEMADPCNEATFGVVAHSMCFSVAPAVANRTGGRHAVDAAVSPMAMDPDCTHCFRRSLPLGADVAVQSAAQYLDGHDDLRAGKAVPRRKVVD